jgi:hypothetical protein
MLIKQCEETRDQVDFTGDTVTYWFFSLKPFYMLVRMPIKIRIVGSFLFSEFLRFQTVFRLLSSSSSTSIMMCVKTLPVTILLPVPVFTCSASHLN